jgi:hypothetical protein
MGLRARDLRAVESVYDFLDELKGAIRRHQLMEDLLGYLRVSVLIAGGVTLGQGSGAPPRNMPTFERVMGREPVSFVDRPPKTAAEIEREDDARQEAASKLALAQLQLFEAQVRMNKPHLIEEEPAPPAEPPSPAHE